MQLIKSPIFLILFLFSNSLLAIDLSKLEGKWAGITSLGDLDMYAALIIKDDLSGEYIESPFTTKRVSKRTFTAKDIIEREGYIEITITREKDISPQKLIFIINGNEIRGMHIAIIKEDTVLYYNLKLMRARLVNDSR